MERGQELTQIISIHSHLQIKTIFGRNDIKSFVLGMALVRIERER